MRGCASFEGHGLPDRAALAFLLQTLTTLGQEIIDQLPSLFVSFRNNGLSVCAALTFCCSEVKPLIILDQ
jgi:hypothetical protein